MTIFTPRRTGSTFSLLSRSWGHCQQWQGNSLCGFKVSVLLGNSLLGPCLFLSTYIPPPPSHSAPPPLPLLGPQEKLVAGVCAFHHLVQCQDPLPKTLRLPSEVVMTSYAVSSNSVPDPAVVSWSPADTRYPGLLCTRAHSAPSSLRPQPALS